MTTNELPPFVDYGIAPEYTVTDLVSIVTLPGDLKRYTFAIREKDSRGEWCRRHVVDLIIPASCVQEVHMRTREDMATASPFPAEATGVVLSRAVGCH